MQDFFHPQYFHSSQNSHRVQAYFLRRFDWRVDELLKDDALLPPRAATKILRAANAMCCRGSVSFLVMYGLKYKTWRFIIDYISIVLLTLYSLQKTDESLRRTIPTNSCICFEWSRPALSKDERQHDTWRVATTQACFCSPWVCGTSSAEQGLPKPSRTMPAAVCHTSRCKVFDQKCREFIIGKVGWRCMSLHVILDHFGHFNMLKDVFGHLYGDGYTLPKTFSQHLIVDHVCLHLSPNISP